jgi:hypothetical protein
MDKETLDFVTEKVQLLAVSDLSKQETQEAAKAWLAAVDGADDAAIDAATEKFLDFMEGRPGTIDGLIAFAQGPAIDMWGEEAAKQFLDTQLARKEAGEQWCNCEACDAAVALLKKFGRI